LTPAQRSLLTDSGLSHRLHGQRFRTRRDRHLVHDDAPAGRACEAKFGGSWKWDAFVQSGRNVADQEITNVNNNANFQRAIDAVQVTAANVGSPAWRWDGRLPFRA
jgi:hypothetical protein